VRVVLGLVSVLLAGCTGVEPAAVGVGLTAAQAGVAFIDGEDRRSFELARYSDVAAAAERAERALGLSVRYRRQAGQDWQITGYDLRGREVMFVEMRAETERVTMVRTEARSPQERGIAALFTQQLQVELDRAEAYLEDWARRENSARNVED
jgi:hypothetical protein